jgi:hypothetical protein
MRYQLEQVPIQDTVNSQGTNGVILCKVIDTIVKQLGLGKSMKG